MRQDVNSNNTNKETKKYTGNAFWDAPPSPISINTSEIHPIVTSEKKTGKASPESSVLLPKDENRVPTAPLSDTSKTENVASAVHPIITQKTESSIFSKKLGIIIVASVVVIAVIIGVIAFAVSSGSRPKTQETNIQSNNGYIENVVDNNSDDVVEEISMPSCENRKYETVKSQLEDLGMIVEKEEAFSDDVSQGYIISQDISKGTIVSVGTTVVVTVSKGEDISPYDYEQKLVVTASKGSSYGEAVLYEWENGDWSEIASYDVTVGSNGIGSAKEGSSTTPKGLHKLGVILASDYVDSNMDIYRATSNTCVIDDSDSSYYNQIMEKYNVPSSAHYDNIGKGLTNGTTYAMIYIEHNGSGFSSENVVAGKGSAIGVRGQYGSISPTYGDVDMSASDMRNLISNLDANKNPMIELIVE